MYVHKCILDSLFLIPISTIAVTASLGSHGFFLATKGPVELQQRIAQ